MFVVNESVDVLNKMVKFGNTSYGIPHIFKALQELNQHDHISRNKLAKKLHIGFGTIRSIILKLKKLEIIETSMKGMFLTSKGKRFVNSLLDKILQEHAFVENSLLTGKYSHAILLKNHARIFKNGMEQRDFAVKYGAKEVISLCYIQDQFSLSKKLLILENHKKVKKILTENLKPENGDLIIITSSDEAFIAEISAKYSALLSLI